MIQVKKLIIIAIALAAVSCNAPGGSDGDLPDLSISSAQITLENAGCYDGSSSMGTRITLVNTGAGPAGMFDVQINSSTVTINSLEGGGSTSIWVPGTLNPPNIVVDPSDMVAEGDEENNTYSDLIPVPTLPLPCPTDTASSS